MYGFWQVTLICLGIMVISLILALVFRHVDENCYVSYRWHDGMSICWIINGISACLTLIFCLIAICTPISAKNNYYKFQEQKVIIEQAIENGTDLENLAITQTIIEYNDWLAGAKASKKTYGAFSPYYYIDLDDLTPIGKK